MKSNDVWKSADVLSLMMQGLVALKTRSHLFFSRSISPKLTSETKISLQGAYGYWP